LREEFKQRPEIREIYVHTTERRGREKYFVEGYEPPLDIFVDIDTISVGVGECVRRILSVKNL
jgi:hypothetical protein